MALYEDDLAHVQAEGFGGFAAGAIAALIPRLQAGDAHRVVDVGCGAGVTTRALVEAGFDTLAIEPSAARDGRLRSGDRGGVRLRFTPAAPSRFLRYARVTSFLDERSRGQTRQASLARLSESFREPLRLFLASRCRRRSRRFWLCGPLAACADRALVFQDSHFLSGRLTGPPPPR